MQNPLEALAQQKRNLQKQRSSAMVEEDSDDHFIVEDDEVPKQRGGKKQKKTNYKHIEHSASDEEPPSKAPAKGQKLLNQYASKAPSRAINNVSNKAIGQKKLQTKPQTMVDDDELDALFENEYKQQPVIVKPTLISTIKHVITNKLDMAKAEFDMPLLPDKPQKRDRQEFEKTQDATQKTQQVITEQKHEQKKIEEQPSKMTDEFDFADFENKILQQAPKKEIKQQQKAQPHPVVQTTQKVPKLDHQIAPVQSNQSTFNESEIIQYTKSQNEESVKQILEDDNSLNFYWFDIWEDNFGYPGELFLFGKVMNKKTQVYESCTVFLPDFQKTVYLLPSRSQGNLDFTEYQTYLNDECGKVLKRHLGINPDEWTAKLVKKRYAFEIKDIPEEESSYLEVKFSGRIKQSLPMKLNSDCFTTALQVTQPLLEQFLIYGDIMGPCWLRLTKLLLPQKQNLRASTKHFLEVPKGDFIRVHPNFRQLPAPPLRVLSLAVKGVYDSHSKQEELLAISYVVDDKVDQDGGDNGSNRILYKSFIRMPENKRWPPEFQRGKNPNVEDVETENALLGAFLTKIDQIDPDVIVGHDLYSRVMGLFLNRLPKSKLTTWNRMSRLQRPSQLPKKHQQFRVRFLTIGRLLVDTFTSAKEMLKSSDYSLDYLSKKYLQKPCIAVESDVTAEYMEHESLISQLIKYNETDAKTTFDIMTKLQVIPLTKQLTTIAGNTWIRSLQSARAERNEMLLMHEFWRQNYILPDSNKQMKAKFEDGNDDEEDGPTKKKYAGGMVLEPKPDIYTDFVLLLDFNSLYPSIIREYNICFTTIQRKKISLEEFTKEVRVEKKPKQKKGEANQKATKDDQEEAQAAQPVDDQDQNIIGIVNPDAQDGILPRIIANLINQRKLAKKRMDESKGIEKQVWNIRQLAVKLVANSMYGCLGLEISRFYALGIASLITSKGREILQKSIKLVTDMGYDVVYGDTDSMMINPKKNEFRDVIATGLQIQKTINKLYKHLQIGIDGVFITLLLLRKKKYAAIKVSNLEDVLTNKAVIIPERETKGIDIVRREYCEFSKMIMNIALDILLDMKDRENIFSNLLDLLKEIDVLFKYQSGEIEGDIPQLLDQNHYLKKPIQVSDFMITKQLNKAPHEYGDLAHHPHVCVAKRQLLAGKSIESLVNHFILYIICKDENEKSVALRARSPEELIRDKLQIDYAYYKQTQIFDPIVRLCKSIDGLHIAQLAEAIGLNADRYIQRENKPDLKDNLQRNNTFETKYLQKQKSTCSNCYLETTWEGLIIESKEPKKSPTLKESLACQHCGEIVPNVRLVNDVKRLMKGIVKEYYNQTVVCKSKKIECAWFSHEIKCFGTCCDLEPQKVKQSTDESEINQQFELLESISQKFSKNKVDFELSYNKINFVELFEKLELGK